MTLTAKFQYWASKNFILTNTAISFMTVASIGIYINIFTSNLTTNPESSPNDIIWSLGMWNYLLVLGFSFLLLQTNLLSIPRHTLQTMGHELMEFGLETACSSLTYHRKNANIRAIVTLIDKSQQTRTTKYSYNVRPDPERTASFPIYFGVTGEAIKTHKVVATDLSQDHMETYSEDIRTLILPELQSVIAAPIYVPDRRRAGPIGVLAFDSSEPLSKLKLDTREAKNVAQMWADLIGYILSTTYISDIVHLKEI